MKDIRRGSIRKCRERELSPTKKVVVEAQLTIELNILGNCAVRGHGIIYYGRLWSITATQQKRTRVYSKSLVILRIWLLPSEDHWSVFCISNVTISRKQHIL